MSAGQSSDKDTNENKSENKSKEPMSAHEELACTDKEKSVKRRQSYMLKCKERRTIIRRQPSRRAVGQVQFYKESSTYRPRSAHEELACTNSQPKVDDVNPAVSASTDKEKQSYMLKCKERRTSIRRQPSRRAAGQVQSYKESLRYLPRLSMPRGPESLSLVCQHEDANKIDIYRRQKNINKKT